MAQEYSGGISVATGFKLNDPQPIDDRLVIASLSDLYSNTALPNVYAGIVVAVASESYALYRWNGTDRTQSSNWIEVGSGGSGGSASIIEYTPTSATDSTYPVGTFTYDSNFIYSRVSSTEWKKAYLYAFGDTSGGDSGSGDTGGGSSSTVMSGSWEFKPVDSDGVFTNNETLSNTVSTLSFGSSSVDDTDYTPALNAITTSNTFTLTDGTSSVDYSISSISTTDTFSYTGSPFTSSSLAMQVAQQIYTGSYYEDIDKYHVIGYNRSYLLNSDLTYNSNLSTGGYYTSQLIPTTDGFLLTFPNGNSVQSWTYAEDPYNPGVYSASLSQGIAVVSNPGNMPNLDWQIAYDSIQDKIYAIGTNLKIDVYTKDSNGTYVLSGQHTITPPTEGSFTFVSVAATIDPDNGKLFIGLSSTTNTAAPEYGWSNYIVNWNCSTDTQGVTWSDSSVYTTDNNIRGHLKGYTMVYSKNQNKVYYKYIYSTGAGTAIYSIDANTGTFAFVASDYNGYGAGVTDKFGQNIFANRLNLDPLEEMLISLTYNGSFTDIGRIINLENSTKIYDITSNNATAAIRNTTTREIFLPNTQGNTSKILEPTYTPNDKVWNFSVSYSTGNNANWSPALGDSIQVTLS